MYVEYHNYRKAWDGKGCWFQIHYDPTAAASQIQAVVAEKDAFLWSNELVESSWNRDQFLVAGKPLQVNSQMDH